MYDIMIKINYKHPLMPYSTTKRKTRQQKIQASGRQTQDTMIALQPEQYQAMASNQTTPSAEQIATATYAYVTQDLRKIGLITLLCLALLTIATLFLSDISAFSQLRAFFHLPTL
jgi:hypothetical protein